MLPMYEISTPPPSRTLVQFVLTEEEYFQYMQCLTCLMKDIFGFTINHNFESVSYSAQEITMTRCITSSLFDYLSNH